MRQKTKILIVSLSDIWATSAKALLSSKWNFDLLDTAFGALGAVEMVRDVRPEVVIIDDSLPSAETSRLLHVLKNTEPSPYCIVMIPSSRHGTKVLNSGADAVVLRYGSPDNLSSAVLTAYNRMRAADDKTQNAA